MSDPTRRTRARAATEIEIRRTARTLLVEQGPDAVTLRAIARELGITAPALYRYYKSRDDLIEQLRQEICADLAAEMMALPEQPDNPLFAICRGFRQWALAHPEEFTLVFASPPGTGAESTMRKYGEPFGRIFLAAAGQVLATYAVVTPPTDAIPPELREDLARFQTELLGALAESGTVFPADKLELGVMFLMVQMWARIYGHITLEVFGNYPIPVSKPDALFDTTLADLAREVGLVAADA
ncbi:MAG: TetR/AcrR family transcriptional regulator [Mycobacteriaceae bacterium]|nr:TetR/AcrR family transcriptional regulator [Mycobacteriaceae bacterium]